MEREKRMNGWDVIAGFILGTVEGLTEFAPVSSTGHMILVDDLWLQSDKWFSQEVANTFKIVIQLGSILAVFTVFWRRLFSLIGIKRFMENKQAATLSIGHVLAAMLPAAILGFLFEDTIDDYLFSYKTVLVGLVVGGILMIVAEKLQPSAISHNLDEISYKQAFCIGLFQCLSLWPGFSRSGSTISGGLLLGVNRKTASEFSFIVAFPIMLGATCLKLYKYWEYLTADALPLFVSGFITAFVVSLLAIKFFLKLIEKVKLTPFAIYRFVIAALIYVFFIM
jgi:undecaprenyl-diphosphatase